MYNYDEKRCPICGITFKPVTGSQRCCSVKCAKVRRKEKQKQSYELTKPRMSQEQQVKLAKAHAKMVRRETEARAAGMSYGRYMAMLRMRREAKYLALVQVASRES